MKTVKMFIKDECPKCPTAKELGKKIEDEGFCVQYFNIGNVEGLAEAMMNQVLATPTILVEDEFETVTNDWRGIVPGKEEVLNALR